MNRAPRDRVLDDIRRALGRTTPQTAEPTDDIGAALARPTSNLIDTFIAAAHAVGTEVHLDPDFPTLLAELADDIRRQRGLPADHPIAVADGAHDDPFDVDIAVVPATLGVATLGSVLLEGPRLLPMTAEITVARLDARTLVATLHDALMAHRPGPTRLFVTGPSKTADIEGILITGVHGPRRFIVAIAAAREADTAAVAAAREADTAAVASTAEVSAVRSAADPRS